MTAMSRRVLDLPVPTRSTFATVRSLLPYLWPRGDREAHTRVLLAAACLVLAKVATVYIPWIYSRAVDALSPAHHPATLPLALILGYGLLRVASATFGELRDAVFSAVQQRTTRRVALDTFRHMHGLSLRFHLDRQTAAVVESVKAASDIYSPVGGEVTAVNEALAGNPALVNTDPYGMGWLFRLKEVSGDDALMDAEAYRKQISA